MTVETQGGGTSLIERAKRILLEPKAEWERIDAEPATVGGIFKGWVLILAAIPAVATLIGQLLFGTSILGVTYRPSPLTAVISALAQYVVSVAAVFVLALIIDALAPTFAGTKNRVQAVKVAAYSVTAGWVAGIAAVFGSTGLVLLVSLLGGLYTLYLLYLGLPRLMKTPADKGVAYTAAVIVAGIVLYLLIGIVTGALASAFGPALPRGAAGQVSGQVSVPGVGALDVGKLEAAAKRLEEQAKRMEQGAAQPAVAPGTLQALLPASLGDFRRVEISSSGAGAGGMGASTAEGRYENGANSFDLKVSDIAAAGALAAMGSAFNVQSNKETVNGYEKMATIDRRMTTEKWNKQAGEGSYGVLVADRFMVEASGKVADVDVLKAAVKAVGFGRLESLKS